MRIEHWVVAQRQGQTAAGNMLGMRKPFSAVPFFWSRHYDVSIQYVGHAENWDAANVDGDITAGAGLVRYHRNGRLLAVASVGRDRDALRCEAELESSANTRVRSSPSST
jgi:hypothetical protein